MCDCISNNDPVSVSSLYRIGVVLILIYMYPCAIIYLVLTGGFGASQVNAVASIRFRLNNIKYLS